MNNTALCFLAALLSVSCLLEKDTVLADTQNVMIQLSVSVGEMTKAVEEESTSAEKLIRDLRVYAFYNDDLVGYAMRGETALREPFYMDLELPETGNCAVEFYLIANTTSMAYENGVVQLTENMTKSQLEAVRFTGLIGTSALPMYDKRIENIDVTKLREEANTEQGHEGHFVLDHEMEPFMLKRSLSKISVYAAKVSGASSDPQILTVNLLAPGTRHFSYLFTQTDDLLKGIATRANDRPLLVSAVNIDSEVASGSAAAEDPQNYDAVVEGAYLPEVAEGLDIQNPGYQWNISSGDNRAATLYVQYTLGENQERRHAYVYLPRIIRNHHYKVCILINAEGQIIINYRVADWDEHEMPTYTFDYPTHSYLRESVPTNAQDLAAKPSKPAQMSESSPFVGYFQMTYPSNDQWTPTLGTLNASKCIWEVREFDTNALISTEVDPQPIPASDKWYKITVAPKTGYMEEGEEVHLSITYTASGLTEPEFLLINGSYGEFYWPYSGIGVDDANYVIITMVN